MDVPSTRARPQAVGRLPMVNEETVIIPGHGAVAGIAELKAFQTLLNTVALRLELLIADGKTAEEVIALNPSVNYDDAWVWSFMPPERFNRLVYDSLIANPGAKPAAD